jgi:L-alanine-DL-glutamate epimerase-like enolase superfamily enzyme
VRVARLETLFCDAGWRPWIFLKATTDDGLVGWAEVTDSHGSPRGLVGIVEDLSPLVVGRDARAVEAIYWELYRATRQSPGSVIQKALAGIENALLDVKAKALGVPVYELFGGPTRDSVTAYWSHCGTTRARAWEVTGTKKLVSYDDVAELDSGRSRRTSSSPVTSLRCSIPASTDPDSTVTRRGRQRRRCGGCSTRFRRVPRARPSRSSTSTSTSRRRASCGSPERSSSAG